MTYGNLKSEVDNTPVLSTFQNITNNISSGEDFMQASKTLTNAQILAADTPYVIVPATEVLNYSGAPTQIPVPFDVFIKLDNSAGIYSNIDNAFQFVIVWGSDWSQDVMVMVGNNLGSAGVRAYRPSIVNINTGANIDDGGGFHHHQIVEEVSGNNLKDNLQDNALAIVLKNGSSGDLEDGNVLNSLTVTVLYYNALL